MKLVYISTGNVPSRWAHTFQTLKMAEALSTRVAEFALLTAGSMRRSPIHDVHIPSWYGVRPSLRVVRLPVHWRVREPFFTRVRNPRFDRAACWYARLARPDLVYTRSLGAAVRCARAGLPTLLEAHGPTKDTEFQQQAFAELARLSEGDALLGLVTVTDPLRAQYVQAGIPDAKIAVWPDAVDPRRYDALPERLAARRRFGLRAEGPLAVYCGHFYEAKGVPVLIEAARSAPDVTLCLVGGMPRDIAAMRRHARGARNVQFEGFVPNRLVPDYLAAADVVVLPNSARFDHAREASPLKLFEAMASGRPIVATRIPAFEGLLRHGENAWLVEPDSPDALVEGIRSVAGDPALAARLAEFAQRDVKPFTWDRRAQDILERFAAPLGWIG